MNDTRRNARAKCAALLGLALFGSPMTAAAATAADLYYERTVMAAADARCGLFTPDVASALAASRAQARGAALRTGADDAGLQQTARRAQAVGSSVNCRSSDVATAAGRVRAAFDGYSRLLRMNFPGDVATWRADRTLPIAGVAWRLAQTAPLGSGSVIFGIAAQRGQAPQLLAVSDFGDGPSPYVARLLLRDPARAPRPYLDVLRVASTAQLPLQQRTPPRAATRVFVAEAMGPTDPRLLPPGGKPATTFRFPAAAAQAIAALDPREAFTVEFVFAGGARDVVRQAIVEVGDFDAAQSFLTVAQR